MSVPPNPVVPSSTDQPCGRVMLGGGVLFALLMTCVMINVLRHMHATAPTPRPLEDNIAIQAPSEPVRVLALLPHDRAAYTEGFLVHNGLFLESTGLPGHSEIRVEDPATGRVLRRVRLNRRQFGEGITVAHGRLVSLTWTEGVGYVWSLPDLQRVQEFHYLGEGWGMTTGADRIWMSDGTSIVRVLDPDTLDQVGTLDVTDAGRPVPNINELEWVKGYMLANVWRTNNILVIDPATGKVLRRLDASALQPAARRLPIPIDDVLNGIAYDAATDRLYITGKQWPFVAQIAWPSDLPPRSDPPRPGAPSPN